MCGVQAVIVTRSGCAPPWLLSRCRERGCGWEKDGIIGEETPALWVQQGGQSASAGT